MKYRFLCSFILLISFGFAMADGSKLFRSGEMSQAVAGCDCTSEARPGTLTGQVKNLDLLACKADYGAHFCDDFYKKNNTPENKRRNCIAETTTHDMSPRDESNATEFAKACFFGFTDATFGLSEKSPYEIAQEDWLTRCDTSIECKYDLLGPYKDAVDKEGKKIFPKELIEGHSNPKVNCADIVNKTYCYGDTSTNLFRKLSAHIQFQTEQHKDTEPWLIPWTGKTFQEVEKQVAEEKKKNSGKSISERMADQMVNWDDHIACYNQYSRNQLRCYAFFSVIDPATAVGWGLKATNLLKLLRGAKVAERTSEVIAGLPRAVITELKGAKSIPVGNMDWGKKASEMPYTANRAYQLPNGRLARIIKRRDSWATQTIIQDPTVNIKVMGSDVSQTLGVFRLSEDEILLPGAQRINDGISKLNKRRKLKEKITISYYTPKVDIVPSEEYVKEFAEKGRLPVAAGGVQSLHDVNGHLLSMFLPNHVLEHWQKTANLFLKFDKFLEKHAPIERQRKQGVMYYAAQFIDGATGTPYLVKENIVTSHDWTGYYNRSSAEDLRNEIGHLYEPDKIKLLLEEFLQSETKADPTINQNLNLTGEEFMKSVDEKIKSFDQSL